MMFLPLIAVTPIARAARTVRGINRGLARSFRCWRARQRENYYFGFLTGYEIDRLARDIGLSRAELLGEQLHPNSRGLAPSQSMTHPRPQIGRKARPMHPTDV